MRVQACGVAIVLVFLAPVNAIAQQVTSSFEDLREQALLKEGDEIWITCDLRETGEYGEYRAEVITLTDSSITISADVSVFGGEEQFVIPADRVRQIDTKRVNHGKGALIGLAIGAGVGLGIGLPIAAVQKNETGESLAGVLVMLIGAGGGAGIGAATGKAEHVGMFVTPETRLAIAPIVTRDRKGLLFAINW